jgi:hypothetical protein
MCRNVGNFDRHLEFEGVIEARGFTRNDKGGTELIDV